MANRDKVIVKGSDLDGAVLENAATEETLKALVKVLNAKDKGSGTKAQELYTQAVEKNVKATDDSSESHKNYQKDLESLEKKTKSFGDTLSNISGMAIGATFSLISATGKSLANFFMKGFESFEKTNSVGASFNYNILELMKAAAEAKMPIEDFTKFVSENSKSLAAFGGTVTEGAKAFSSLREQFSDPTVNKELYNLGFNSENLNKILSEQLKTELVSGRSRELDRTKFTKELKEYTKDLNVLSKVTGVSTDQLQEGVTQQLSDGRMMALQSKLTGKALINFRDGLALMNAELDPKVFDSLKNMMSGVIDPGDKFGKMLAIAAPGILEFQEALGEGKLDVSQQLAGYERQVDQIGSFLGRFSKQQIARIPELKAMEEYLASIKKFTGDNGRAALEAKNAQDGIIGVLSSFGEIMNRAKNLFFSAMVKSGTMKKIQDALERLAKYIERVLPDIIKRLEPVMTKAANWVDQFVDSVESFIDSFLRGDLKPENLWNWVKQTFSGAINVITEGIGTVISGLLGQTPEQQQQRQAYNQATPEEQEKMRKQNPALAIPDVGGMFDKMVSGLKSLIDMVPSLKDLALFFGITGAGTFVAGLGIGAGLSAVAKGMLELAVPALAVGAAIGLGAGGLGYAFNGLANIVKEVSDSFGKLTNFFKSTVEIDPTKLSAAGSALEPLSENLIKLASSGIIGLIGGGGLDSITSALIKVSSIDTKKITDTGPALKSLHEGLVSFNDQSLWDTLTGSFKEFAGGKVIETITASLSNLGNVDLSKLQSIGNVTTTLASLKPFLDSNIMQKIPESMNNVRDSLVSFAVDISNSISKLTPSSLQSFSNFADGITKLSNIDTSKFDSNKISSFADGISKLSNIDTSKLDSSKISSFADGILKFASIDSKSIENTVSGINKISTTINDNFTNQTNGVNDYIKSIDKLTDSLTKLEKQLKDVPNVTNASTDFNSNVGTRVIASSNKTSEMTSDDLQRQLNSKIEELITHIVEMKQNTKDTADSIKGRRSAV